MSPTVVSVEGISKRYRIGPSVRPGSSLRESISETVSGGWKRLKNRRTRSSREETDIWALRDVSFDVKEGEVLGLIGRNGAGKSTLLKILSRITEPTEGRAVVHGRVASLLEVGTGFHGDLTGRENVLLNGAVLGMRREEIRRKFDEIVAFSEVGRFIDTPVKRYSSGMYMRLAFAVAAHLEPEILMVDEVLAVGDAEFQKKCLGKMKEVSGQGRTVLFVSHNMGAVSSLCSRCALLGDGLLVSLGPTKSVVDAYVSSPAVQSVHEALQGRIGKSQAWIEDAYVESCEGVRCDAVPVDAGFQLVMTVGSRGDVRGVDLDVRVETRNGVAVCTTGARHMNRDFAIRKGRTRHTVRFPGSFLAPGTYYFTVAIHRPNLEFYALCERLLAVEIVESGSDMWRHGGTDIGCVLARLPWEEAPQP